MEAARGPGEGAVGQAHPRQFDVIGGKREQFVGRIQEKYGIAKEEAEQQVDRFAAALEDEQAKPENGA
jgi:uncharacterized protein YjbJ (UPF0337 family)